MKYLKDFGMFLLSELPMMIAMFTLGFLSRAVFPTASDKRMMENDYHIACLDTRLNDIDTLAGETELKGCDVLWKERNEQRKK